MVYVDIPFLQGYHADPHDYQRYTIQGIKALFNQFEEVEIGVSSGPFSALTWFFRKFPTIMFSDTYVIKGIEFITGWLFFSIKYLDYLVIKFKNSHTLASGLYFIGKKNEH